MDDSREVGNTEMPYFIFKGLFSSSFVMNDRKLQCLEMLNFGRRDLNTAIIAAQTKSWGLLKTYENELVCLLICNEEVSQSEMTSLVPHQRGVCNISPGNP